MRKKCKVDRRCEVLVCIPENEIHTQAHDLLQEHQSGTEVSLVYILICKMRKSFGRPWRIFVSVKFDCT